MYQLWVVESLTLILAMPQKIYREISRISRTVVGDKIIYPSDAVGALPVGAAPTTSTFST